MIWFLLKILDFKISEIFFYKINLVSTPLLWPYDYTHSIFFYEWSRLHLHTVKKISLALALKTNFPTISKNLQIRPLMDTLISFNLWQWWWMLKRFSSWCFFWDVNHYKRFADDFGPWWWELKSKNEINVFCI